MRLPDNAATLILAATLAVALVPEIGRAQGQSQVPMPPGGFKPPPVAPVKPYTPVAVTPPSPYDDPSFAAFRKQLAEVAQHKDRAALAKLVVSQGFFWMQDKDVADKRKSAMANFAAATNLEAKDGSGWALLFGYANEPTGAPLPNHQGVICAPADPTLDPKAFEAVIKATQTEPPDWGYPAKGSLEVHSAAKASAPVIEKLGSTLVRVLPDSAPPDNPNEEPFLHIATPSGKSGYVLLEALSSLGGDQMCYIKDASGWKITGYLGGVAQ